MPRNLPAAGSKRKTRAPESQANTAREFGLLLRDLRDVRGISQETLAELADLDRTYSSLLERGLRTPTLTVPVLLRLAEALKMEPARLVIETVARLRGERVLRRRRLSLHQDH